MSYFGGRFLLIPCRIWKRAAYRNAASAFWVKQHVESYPSFWLDLGFVYILTHLLKLDTGIHTLHRAYFRNRKLQIVYALVRKTKRFKRSWGLAPRDARDSVFVDSLELNEKYSKTHDLVKSSVFSHSKTTLKHILINKSINIAILMTFSCRSFPKSTGQRPAWPVS